MINELRLAKIVEGDNYLQCTCPTCNYGEGYLDYICLEFCKEEIIICETCGTEFIGLVT